LRKLQFRDLLDGHVHVLVVGIGGDGAHGCRGFRPVRRRIRPLGRRDGEHLALRTHDTAEDAREIATARYEVGDVLSRLQSREGDALRGLAVRVTIAIRLRPCRIGDRGGRPLSERWRLGSRCRRERGETKAARERGDRVDGEIDDRSWC
jgi:hypothetical protein